MSNAQLIADIELDLAARKRTIVDLRQHCESTRRYNKRPNAALHWAWTASMSAVGIIMAQCAFNSMAVGDDWRMIWYYFIALYYAGFITKGQDTYRENLAAYQRVRVHQFELLEVLAEREEEYKNIAEALEALKKSETVSGS